MSQWRTYSFWTKAWILGLLALMAVVSDGADLSSLGEGSSHRKRVFSPGFIVLCIFVAVCELILLNHFYGV
ncbi:MULTISPECIES: hypothetical protein [Pseudomonas]|jgi:hypothetical protein|uniref:Uncharacterized protein n=1 Tax=Pseudomonas fluorescens TaxID=294 RepID=A0A4Y9TIM8_PSEFL|nr:MULTISPECIES: hypothetical protein [Pseudomonas]MCX9150945.1 hypothetical protein [Pseudomonas sp. TB1-B1]TFW42892.1 hypothetical protein E4T65_14065 [Pseudomonas fluorescens]CRM96545.1 hypothetical protein [Pseudomonas sp. 22 E 5]TKJ64338.1 hypothetical protein PspCFBP13506_07350 [Pseudomonas sp. CFBP13506]CRM19448.1 hypothetical protein [Pseudomonas sp. 31 E 5]